MSSLFEQASRKAFRYPSSKGALTTEQLWDLPLTARTGCVDLDTVAKTLNTELKTVAEESFVSTKPAPVKALLVDKLDVVKHVIAVKLAEAAAASDAAARKAEREKLMGILADKTDDALKALTPEQIRARIAELS